MYRRRFHRANYKFTNSDNENDFRSAAYVKALAVLHAGLVFNGVAVLGLAAEGTDQVTIQGDVELHVQPLLSHRLVAHHAFHF